MSDNNEVVEVQTDTIEDASNVPVVDSETEKEARAQGWVPKEEFRGKESDWIEAETFVQRGREINPILRKNNERIQRELDKAKRDLDDLRIGVEEFKKFQREATERKLANYETELLELREQKKQAITSGDGELAVQLDDEMDAVKDARAAAKASAAVEVKAVEKPAEVPEAIANWVSENKWYHPSKAMADQANEYGMEIRDKFPFYTEAQFLSTLDKMLEETYTPEKLGRKVKVKNPMDSGTSTSTSTGTSGKKNSYESLPADAKAACDSFVKQGLYKTKQEYVDEYYA